MASGLFLRAAAVQAAGVAVLFAILLALPLSEDFFEDFGWLVGPISWIACALVTGRVLRLPLALAVVAAVAGGVGGMLIGLASTHFVGLVVAVAVFGAACSGYDDDEETSPDRPEPVG